MRLTIQLVELHTCNSCLYISKLVPYFLEPISLSSKSTFQSQLSPLWFERRRKFYFYTELPVKQNLRKLYLNILIAVSVGDHPLESSSYDIIKRLAQQQLNKTSDELYEQ